jgi:hypothetical protein
MAEFRTESGLKWGENMVLGLISGLEWRRHLIPER